MNGRVTPLSVADVQLAKEARTLILQARRKVQDLDAEAQLNEWPSRRGALRAMVADLNDMHQRLAGLYS